jgi:AraC-like DNA-binding protein
MLDDLAQAVRRYTDNQTGESPFATAIEGLTILRSDHEKPHAHIIYKPALCIVVQGAKWAMFGSTQLEYRAGQALVVSVEMPGLGRVVEASPSEPYLGLIVEFDPAMMREMAGQGNAPLKSQGEAAGSGIFVLDLDSPLADCILRLVRLLDMPGAIPTLSPLIMREICYWLLTSPYGGEIARIGLANGHAHRIIQAIHALRDRFAEPVRIEELAVMAHMSPSAFHRQFKALTLMTPLQYQKHLRLLEARRLMVTDAANVETAAFQVGYESPSQFSREYARMFGAPPRRDVVGLKRAWPGVNSLQGMV